MTPIRTTSFGPAPDQDRHSLSGQTNRLVKVAGLSLQAGGLTVVAAALPLIPFVGGLGAAGLTLKLSMAVDSTWMAAGSAVPALAAVLFGGTGLGMGADVLGHVHETLKTLQKTWRGVPARPLRTQAQESAPAVDSTLPSAPIDTPVQMLDLAMRPIRPRRRL